MGPLLGVSGGFRSLLEPLGRALGASWGDFGGSGGVLGHLGAVLGPLGAVLWVYVGT